MIKNNNLQIISFLKFPLMLGVLLGHSIAFPRGHFPVYDIIYRLLSTDYGQTCVPLFFFFSGYLFFLNVDRFTVDTYKTKLKRRVSSLLVPYIFWNLFYIGAIWLGQIFMPSAFRGSFDSVGNLDLANWLSLFYCAFDTNMPVAFHMWFVRDLLILSLFTPLFYYLSKKLSYWWLFVPFLAYLLQATIFNGIGFLSLTFFVSGCYFGIYKLDFSLRSPAMKWACVILYLVLLLIEYMTIDMSIHEYLVNFNKAVGCVAIMQFTSILLDKNSERHSWFSGKKMGGYSFYLYCYHGLFATFLDSRLSKYVNNDLNAVLCYFFIVITLVVFGYLTYIILLKLTPGFLKVISGGRN